MPTRCRAGEGDREGPTAATSPVAAGPAVARVCPSGANAATEWPVSGSPRRRGWAGSVTSHSSTVSSPSSSATAVARVRPSGANATELTASVWPVSGSPRRRGCGGVGQIPQQHRLVAAVVARVCPSGANATGEHIGGSRSAAHRGGGAGPGRPRPTAARSPSSAGGGQGPPVRGERHRTTPPVWPVSGSPSRRGWAGSVRSHSSTVAVAPAVARVRPSGANATAAPPAGVAGQRLTETARLGPVGEIPQQDRPIGRQRWPGCARPGRTPPRSPRRSGRSAVYRDGAAWPGRPDPTTSPYRSRRWPGCAHPGRTPPPFTYRSGRSAAHRDGAAWPGRPDPTTAPSRRRGQWPGSARPGRTPPTYTLPESPANSSSRRRGLARSVRSHNSDVPAEAGGGQGPPVRRRTPPRSPVGRAGRQFTEAARLGPVGEVPQPQRWRFAVPAGGKGLARPGRTPPRHPRCGRSAGHRGGAAWPGRRGPTTAPFPLSAGGGQGLPVRGERHASHPSRSGRSAAHRGGAARPGRPGPTTAPSPSTVAAPVARVCPSGANATATTVRWGRSAGHRGGAAGPGRRGPTAAPSHRPAPTVARVCPSGANATSSHPRRCGRSAAHRDGAAGPGRSGPTTAPSRPRWRWPGSARPGRTPPRSHSTCGPRVSRRSGS